MSKYFIGVDAGGTNTRALVTTQGGEILGVGRAEGANTWSSGTSVSHVLAEALCAAINGLDPAAVVGGVVAIAGATSTRLDLRAEIDGAWSSAGLPGSPELIPDMLAAYLAGTTAAEGLVLVAGTGAIGATISGEEVVRRSGGHGWLVGDEGSAVWLGIEAIRATLRALDTRGPGTTLTRAVSAKLHVDETDARSATGQIVAAAHSLPPAQLGQLAPLVADAYRDGDPVASALIVSAVDHLTAAAIAASGGKRPRTVVLAGSLLAEAGPIGRPLRAKLSKAWPNAAIVDATSGEAGATALAIKRHTGAATSIDTLARLRGDENESG